ncbi:hypothetical protein [Thalassobacillus pellis]|uniref:hypothetical protein n=1 Tax=Thalassobacillus pellis TaxID=748008 RepID=UPI00195FDE85|nr:hypothetical protein [Thalassobacillus pellis]MBM7553464.1 putative membrane protein [Thalassobacillus pellis]
MSQYILSLSFFIIFLISFSYFLVKRKKAGITGIKSAIPSICFFLIALINFAANTMDLLGSISWFLTITLIIVGASFTKYLPIDTSP